MVESPAKNFCHFDLIYHGKSFSTNQLYPSGIDGHTTVHDFGSIIVPSILHLHQSDQTLPTSWHLKLLYHGKTIWQGQIESKERQQDFQQQFLPHNEIMIPPSQQKQIESIQIQDHKDTWNAQSKVQVTQNVQEQPELSRTIFQMFPDHSVRSSTIKIHVLATDTKQVEKIKVMKEDPLLRPIDDGSRRLSSKLPMASPYRTPSTHYSSSYGFQSIVPLPNFADVDKARALLERLRNDVEVVGVMNKRRWSVPKLVEMYPDGKVGVDPVCVLGLNKGQGMEIQLRLRTDDLKGFRYYDKIKTVLWHELAHNVHTEHDQQFFALMNELEREGKSFNFRNTQGRTLADSSTHRHDLHQVYHVYKRDSQTSSSVQNSGRRLGGSHIPSNLASRQEFLAQVAESRNTPALVNLSAPEPTDIPQIGDNYVEMIHVTDSVDSHLEVDDSKLDKTRLSLFDELNQNQNQNQNQNHVYPIRDTAKLTEINSNHLFSKDQNKKQDSADHFPENTFSFGESESEKHSQGSKTHSFDQPAENQAIRPLSEPYHHFRAFEIPSDVQDDPTLEKVLALKSSLNKLLEESHRRYPEQANQVVASVVRLLQTYTTNALEPDPKFKKINRNNKTFATKLAPFLGALSFLKNLGFSDNHQSVLVLTRDDPGLLWIGKSLLNEFLVQ